MATVTKKTSWGKASIWGMASPLFSVLHELLQVLSCNQTRMHSLETETRWEGILSEGSFSMDSGASCRLWPVRLNAIKLREYN